mmetsp:Transcript_95194/g.272887  ORF Transcript_95194/g.272887 Transcript_95194/m.272887 type:complete len:202 (-) Transcript_95194:446-1051(-)
MRHRVIHRVVLEGLEGTAAGRYARKNRPPIPGAELGLDGVLVVAIRLTRPQLGVRPKRGHVLPQDRRRPRQSAPWLDLDEAALALVREGVAQPPDRVHRIVGLREVDDKVPIVLQQGRHAIQHHLHARPVVIAGVRRLLHADIRKIPTLGAFQTKRHTHCGRCQLRAVDQVQEDISMRVQSVEHPPHEWQAILHAELHQEG